MITVEEYIKKRRPCGESRKFLRSYPTLRKAWMSKTVDPSDMLWAIQSTHFLDQTTKNVTYAAVIQVVTDHLWLSMKAVELGDGRAVTVPFSYMQELAGLFRHVVMSTMGPSLHGRADALLALAKQCAKIMTGPGSPRTVAGLTRHEINAVVQTLLRQRHPRMFKANGYW